MYKPVIMISNEYKIIISAFIVAILLWVVDAAVEVSVFSQRTFGDVLIFNASLKEICFRSFFSACILLYGGVIARSLAKRRIIENVLQQSEEKYRTLVESTEDSIYLVDSNYRYIFINKKHLERLGLQGGDSSGRAYSNFHSPEETKEFIEKVDIVLKTGKSLQHEYKSRRDDKYFIQTYSPVHDSKGNSVAVTVVSKDITERKQAEKELKDSKAMLNAVFNNMQDVFYRTDKEGRIVWASPSAANLLGCASYETLLGKDITELYVNPDKKEDFLEKLSVTGKVTEYEMEIKRLDGNTITISTSAHYYRDRRRNVAGVEGICRDISKRKAAEETLQALSLTDELTGLCNRRGFFALAEHKLKEKKRQLAGALLLYADLDNLKTINDTHGHQEGDLALMELAAILKETYRGSDIIARIGGDEFVVFPVSTADSEINFVISRLQNNLESRNQRKRGMFDLSVSIGTALYDPVKNTSVDELLAHADRLMYEHKKQKRS